MPKVIPAPRAEGTTSTTAAPLYWARFGRVGGSSLVVLHGGPGASHEYLLPQMLELGGEHDLLFYDQRGGGRSRTDDPTPITWQVHVADLGRLVSELNPGPLTLVGYSWGAMLALLYTITSRDKDDAPAPVRLVLIDPAPLNRAYRGEFEREFQRRQQSETLVAMRQELTASGLRERDPEAFRQRTFELSVAGYFADPARAVDLTPFRVTGRVQQSVWESLGDFDLFPELERLNVPTLMVHGWLDPIPAESTLRAARAMQARCVVLEASGHVPYVEQPGALFNAIAQFLKDTDSLVRQGV